MTTKSIDKLNWLNPDIKLLKANSSWVLPQLTAFVARTLVPVHLDSNKLSPSLTLKALANRCDLHKVQFTSKWDSPNVSKLEYKNILEFLTTRVRGDILAEPQTKATRWAANVPIVFAALKEINNIPYASWDLDCDKAKFLVDQPNLEVFKTKPVNFTTSELLEFRQLALEVKTGKSSGTLRKPESTTSVVNQTNKEFASLSRLVKLLALQLWVYQPHLVSSLALQNLSDWDKALEPLVSQEIFVDNQTNWFSD